MRTFLFFIALLFVSTLPLFGEEMDAKMQKIREASPQERVKLMNELKREIAAMNREQRDEAIKALRLKMNGHKERAQRVQSQQFQNMQKNMQSQNFTQKQTGSQYMKGKEINRMKLKR
jgi:phage-related minor tail protein